MCLRCRFCCSSLWLSRVGGGRRSRRCSWWWGRQGCIVHQRSWDLPRSQGHRLWGCLGLYGIDRLCGGSRCLVGSSSGRGQRLCCRLARRSATGCCHKSWGWSAHRGGHSVGSWCLWKTTHRSHHLDRGSSPLRSCYRALLGPPALRLFYICLHFRCSKALVWRHRSAMDLWDLLLGCKTLALCGSSPLHIGRSCCCSREEGSYLGDR